MSIIRDSLLERVMAEGEKQGCIRLDANRKLLNRQKGYFPSRCAVTAGLLEKLRGGGLDCELPGPAKGFYRRYSALYRMLGEIGPQVLENHGFRSVLPPAGVHALGIRKGFLLDLRNADMLEEAANEAGFSMQAGSILDFGCSSGQTVRSFWEAFPDVKWHGTDPNEKTIEWAQDNFPEIAFHVNERKPPIGFFGDEIFDGVYAKSVWSHFSERASVAWMQEMHRILKPGGFLMFTVPGYHRLAERLCGGEADFLLKEWRPITFNPILFTEDYLVALAKSFLTEGFHFNQKPEPSPDWGTTFMRRDWVETRLLSGRFELISMKPARTAGSQDVYVCRRSRLRAH